MYKRTILFIIGILLFGTSFAQKNNIKLTPMGFDNTISSAQFNYCQTLSYERLINERIVVGVSFRYVWFDRGDHKFESNYEYTTKFPGYGIQYESKCFLSDRDEPATGFYVGSNYSYMMRTEEVNISLYGFNSSQADIIVNGLNYQHDFLQNISIHSVGLRTGVLYGSTLTSEFFVGVNYNFFSETNNIYIHYYNPGYADKTSEIKNDVFNSISLNAGFMLGVRF